MKGLILTDLNEIAIQNGVTVIDDNRADCIKRVLEAATGEFKEVPTIGGNVRKLVAGGADPFWIGQIKAQLKSLNIELEDLKVFETGIEISLKN
jgi:hypothetical protein